MDPVPADCSQLENFDLPADARDTCETLDAGCILVRYKYKIHLLSKAGGSSTEELHLAIQHELRMESCFANKPYVLMTTGDLPRRVYSTFYTGIPEKMALQLVFVAHDGTAASLDPAGYKPESSKGTREERTDASLDFDTPENCLPACRQVVGAAGQTKAAAVEMYRDEPAGGTLVAAGRRLARAVRHGGG